MAICWLELIEIHLLSLEPFEIVEQNWGPKKFLNIDRRAWKFF